MAIIFAWDIVGERKRKLERNSEPQNSQISNKMEESVLKKRKAELEGRNKMMNGHGTVHLD